MSGIKIDIGTELDSSGVESGIKRLEQTVKNANKTAYNPIGKDTLKQLDEVNRRFQQLLKVSTELSRRIGATGQGGKAFDDIDFSAVFPNPQVMQRKMREINAYVGMGAGGSGGGAGNGGGSNWKQASASAVQAGLRAAGPVTGGFGNVAAGALGTGMASGAGAGMAGLLGGVVALGVGKLVGAVADKVSAAQDNSVALDRLKRTLGDVNVSFAALKTAIGGSATGLGVSISDNIALSSRYAKMGNLSGGNAAGLVGEVGAGIGLSRAYGLDPSQGVGVLGTLRGIGVTRSEQDTRRFAVLIGETIGKSGAFAKADEVMEAIGGYAENQMRSTPGNANVGGFAGMLAGLVGSGIPGLDPTGANSILGRVNAALAGGGAFGEASQFLTARIGAARGLDVFKTQAWREGGAFSTLSSAFAPDGAIGRFVGGSLPQGNETMLDAAIGALRQSYGGNKMMLLNAAGNHFGLNMSQTAALLEAQGSGQLGSISEALKRSGVDMSKVNLASVGTLSKVVGGTGADRSAIASDLLGRTGSDKLNDQQRKALADVMRGGSEQQQKDMLTALVAVRDQGDDQGKNIRDSRVALDNIATDMADKMIPLTQDMRDLLLDGFGKGRSMGQIRNDAQRAEINERYDAQAAAIKEGGVGFMGMKPEAKAALAELERKRKEELAAVGNVPAGSTSDAMKFFMDKGWSKEQAAGIVANLDAESGLKPGAVGDSGEAYGIAQWHKDRQANFKKWAGKDIRDSTQAEQLGFVDYELTQGAEAAAGDRLRKASSAAEAGAIVSRYYERPGLNEAAKEREARARAGMATSIYGTPMPSDAAAANAAASQGVNIQAGFAEPLRVIHEDRNGNKVRQDQFIDPFFGRAAPAGGRQKPFAN